MFEVVLTLIGLGFAAWVLIAPALREQIRAKLAGRPKRLWALGMAVLLITLTFPFAIAFIPTCMIWRDLSLGFGQFVTVGLAILGIWAVWPSGDWTEAQLRSFQPRVESLILTGEASTVVDVLDKAFPRLPKRSLRTGDEVAPHLRSYETCFDEVLADALVHVEFIRTAARHNRPFLAKMLSHTSRAGFFASEAILTELMFGPDRLLPRELEASTNIDGESEPYAYRIPKWCIILHTLFDDIAIADQLACWKPIGNGVIREIVRKTAHSDQDPDQRPFVEEEEKARWSSSVGAGIWFFRVMATSAAKQGHTWHMWLPYLTHFVERIDEVIVVPEQHRGEEFPNQYSYWIADCLNCCADVIRMAAIVQDDNPNRLMGDGGSVVSTAFSTYGSCLVAILESEKLPDRFKMDRVEVLCMHYEEWERPKYPRGWSAYAVAQLRSRMSTEDQERVRAFVDRVVRREPHRESYARLLEALVG